MNIFTKDQFRDAAQSLSNRNAFFSFQTESRSYSQADSLKRTIFLSHSHHDAKYVNMARTFFENLGISIYVDWADASMPKKTCGETAKKIKTKILQDDFFVLLATNLSVSSKWCNWEVGVGDAFKALKDKIIILPLADNSYNWEGNEYLQTYPYIQGHNNSYLYGNPNMYMVHYPDGNELSLVEWLKKK